MLIATLNKNISLFFYQGYRTLSLLYVSLINKVGWVVFGVVFFLTETEDSIGLSLSVRKLYRKDREGTWFPNVKDKEPWV